MINQKTNRHFALLILFSISFFTTLYAQQRMVKGVVKDESGETLTGVNVILKDGQKGTITDSNGEFSIQLLPNKTILLFSYIGYESAAINAANQKYIQVTLKQSNMEMDELVVLGYGSVRKSDLTGSVATVSSEDLKNQAITSVDQMMQGRVSGVNIVSNNGAPGGGVSINIRGASTISGSTTPLYVIDGLPIDNYVATPTNGTNEIAMQPVTNPLANINPNEIESMEILKDASATAIYGSRGANGVILITTKQGKKGKTKVQYSGRMNVTQLRKKYEVLSTSEMAQYQNEKVDSWNRQNPTATSKPYTNTLAQIDSLRQFNSLRDMQDLIYRTAISQEHQISFSGADEKSNFLFSANYLNQEGIVKKSKLERLGFRLNYTRELIKNLKMETKLSYSNSKNNMILQSQGTGDLGANTILGALTFSPLKNVEAIIEEENGNLPDATTSYGGNPYLLVNRVKDILTQNNIIGNLSLQYNFNKYLTLELNGGMNQNVNVRNAYHPRGTLQGNQNRGLAFKGYSTRTNLMLDVLLKYNRNFGKMHRLNAVAGHTYQNWYVDNLNVQGSQFMDDTMGNENMAWGLASTRPNSQPSTWALESYLARFNYTLADKYIFTFTGRADGSTRLAPGNKWSFFPSAALAWRINQEPFLKSVEQISNIKLKLSYGVSGSQNIAVGATEWRMGVEYVPINGEAVQGIVPSSMPNPNLGWETTAQYNGGLETGFFNNRLRLNLDFYYRNTSDLLFNIPLSPSSGYSTFPVNMGEIENKGMEIELAGDIFTKKLKWTISGNISMNRNKVLSMGDLEEFTGPTYLSSGLTPLNQPVSVVRVGQPVGMLYGYKTNGVYQNEAEVAAGPESASAKPGDLKYIDLSGTLGVPDGKIDANDRTIIGNPYPKFDFGITNNLSYKNFTLSVFVQSSIGSQVANLNRYILDGMADNGLNISKAAFYGAWRGEGTSNYYPAVRPLGNTTLLERRFSTYLIDDASYIRLKNISLSYNFNVKKLKFINSLQIFASGSNLITITDYRGYDPEVSAFGSNSMTPGIDMGTYPAVKSVSVGLNITL